MMAFHKTVTITTDEIAYRMYGRKVKHDRSVPHRFVLLDHRWRPFEAGLYNLMGRKSRWLKRYYQRSFRLAIEVIGVRKTITTIYGEDTAKKNLSRLNAALATQDATSRTGKGVALDIADEWSKEAGGLPD